MPSRRFMLAASAGLAASVSRGNYAFAQIDGTGVLDAADALSQMAPLPAPRLHFTNAGGKALTLADYAGFGLVVNLWATWCGPCEAELPSLAAVAPVLAAHKILVLPISLDMDGAKAVQPYFASRRISTLPVLLDEDGNALSTLGAPGIPATVVVNPRGQMVANLIGMANWNTPRTVSLLRKLAGPAPKAQAGVMPV